MSYRVQTSPLARSSQCTPKDPRQTETPLPTQRPDPLDIATKLKILQPRSTELAIIRNNPSQ